MSVKEARQERSEATRSALKRAAEKLIADKGISKLSIRALLTLAGQKNESALQYHFRNLDGLLEAIAAERAEQIQARRSELLTQAVSTTTRPDLRTLCRLMVQPVFDLARASIEFRRYIKGFGHELALAESSALSVARTRGGGGSSGNELGVMLRAALPHLEGAAYQRRMDAAVRLASASMYHQARQKNAFRGPESDLFLHSLVDALVGLLHAEESDATRAIAKSLAPG